LKKGNNSIAASIPTLPDGSLKGGDKKSNAIDKDNTASKNRLLISIHLCQDKKGTSK